jgi:hypothetical protein
MRGILQETGHRDTEAQSDHRRSGDQEIRRARFAAPAFGRRIAEA